MLMKAVVYKLEVCVFLEQWAFVLRIKGHRTNVITYIHVILTAKSVLLTVFKGLLYPFSTFHTIGSHSCSL